MPCCGVVKVARAEHSTRTTTREKTLLALFLVRNEKEKTFTPLVIHLLPNWARARVLFSFSPRPPTPHALRLTRAFPQLGDEPYRRRAQVVVPWECPPPRLCVVGVRMCVWGKKGYSVHLHSPLTNPSHFGISSSFFFPSTVRTMLLDGIEAVGAWGLGLEENGDDGRLLVAQSSHVTAVQVVCDLPDTYTTFIRRCNTTHLSPSLDRAGLPERKAHRQSSCLGAPILEAPSLQLVCCRRCHQRRASSRPGLSVAPAITFLAPHPPRAAARLNNASRR